jgi:hypothetical protein
MNYSVALRQSSFLYINSWLFLVPFAIAGFSVEVLNPVHQVSLLYQFLVHTKSFSKIPLVDKILVMPAHHNVHHARNKIYHDKNFGSVFIIWDRWFGTYAEACPEISIKYGTEMRMSSWSPLAANLCEFHQYLRAVASRFRLHNAARTVLTRPEHGDTEDRGGSAIRLDPSIPQRIRTYAIVQFIAVMILVIDYVFRLSGHFLFNTKMHLGFLIVSLVVIPQLFDGRSSVFAWERLRLALMGVLAMLTWIAAPQAWFASVLLLLFAAASLVALQSEGAQATLNAQ